MCGVFGVWDVEEASRITYLGLHGLQHRGQESAGIVTAKEDRLYSFKRMGRVADVFDESALDALPGRIAIGHVRYSTSGTSIVKNAQPFAVEFSGGSLAIAHNGNLTNAGELRQELEDTGSLFHTAMDTEVFVHLLAQVRGTLVERLRLILPQIEGAYSLLILTPTQMIAVRDPHGFRPLIIGRMASHAPVVASETCALRLVGAAPEREIEPGEIVVFDINGECSHRISDDSMDPKSHRQCIFEHVYFARSDSKIFGERVYEVRKELGRRLAQECPVSDAEVVIPVPDSGTAAAIGYAQEAGLPYEMGLIRSHYAGRTFIEPSSSIRHFGVKLKLSPVEHVIRDKIVVVVDDSIVRGITCQKIVRMLREAGAREVHVRISCPPITNSCFYGIDTPTRSELIAANSSVAQTVEYLAADSLAYLSLTGLHNSVKSRSSYCDACFTGNYPVPVPQLRFEERLTELG
jgi:amidophosphoribosyltransferase